jgi:hypothetical protein
MLKKNQYYSPFLGDYKSLSVGLNPLGIRTASEQLFTTLLPGLNVVTLRIRYYSFYCWLMKCFYANRTEASRLDFQRHIRMSELLMALIHAQSNNSGGVPGITRANEIIWKGASQIDFNEDAMPEGKPTGGYWKGSYGAFGTYYVASLEEMGIISPLIDNPSLYNVTPESDNHIGGEVLANAFAESIGNKMEELFQQCAGQGIVTREQLATMEPYFQSHNMPNNRERELLLQMLLQADRPSSLDGRHFRKETLRLLLNYLLEEPTFSELDFARYVYKKYSNQEDQSMAAAGWYAYYLNDSRQFEALNIFDVVLQKLQNSKKPGQWESIDDFTSQLATEVCDALGASGQTMKQVMDNWDSINNPDEQMSHAFYVIFDDYRRNPNYQECKALIKTHFRNVSNDALDAFDNMEQGLNDSVYQFIKRYLTENIIYNHYSESMRKYSQNGIPTQKLTIENGYVRGLTTFGASHSSPRVGTLKNYATDLGLIENDRVTAVGKNLLNALSND